MKAYLSLEALKNKVPDVYELRALVFKVPLKEQYCTLVKRRFNKDEEKSQWVLFEKDSRDVIQERKVKQTKPQILVYHLK